jgi:TonB-dependent starch-binding outer membrane protein SusC
MTKTRCATRIKHAARRMSGLAIAACLSVCGVGHAAAQSTGTVTGLVRDAVSQAPLAGAQVSLEGTGLGGLVNNVGRFLILNVPAGQHTLNVQLIGYAPGSETVTVTAGGTANITVPLREQALSLDGVIVTGTAGQARRREVGNQISAVGAGDIEVAATTSVSDVLQGRSTGVQINDFGGQVGTGAQIRLRGNNSLTQSNSPLIYVDGVRISTDEIIADDEAGGTPSAFDMLNSNDIERIEIIKGPAATTLYGTQASGGVIQVFTKRGASGAPAWTLRVEQGLSALPHQGPKGEGSDFDDLYMLDPNGEVNPYGLNLNDCFTGGPSAGEPREPGCPASGSWLRNAHMQRYNLSVRGGGETATYFVSGRWARQEGVVEPQGADDYSVRANISFQPFDGIDIGVNNSYSRRNITWIPDGNNAGGFLLNVLRGDAGYTPGNDDSLVLENANNSELNQWVTSASIGWTPNNTLSHRLNFGMDYTFTEFQDMKEWGFYEIPTGERESDAQTFRNLTFDYNGTFRYEVTGSIATNTSWGGQLYEEYDWRLNGFDGLFAGPGDQLVGDGNERDADEQRETLRSGGFFLQEMIGFQDKLFITGGMRWDGFSTFGEGFGLATYPKLSAAYTVSDESFWPSGIVETMKLRAAWGKSGRAPNAFDAERVYEATSADELVPAVTIDNLGNADLGPEISTELEMGFEASTFGGRLSVDFTWYDQSTKDALICLQEAPSLGTEQCTWRNLGETKNWGTETSVQMVPVRTDGVEWALGVGYSTNDSEVVDLGTVEDLGEGRQVGLPLRMQFDDILQNPGQMGVLPEYETGFIGPLFPKELINLSSRVTLDQGLTLDLLVEGQRGHVRPIGAGYQNMRRGEWPTCLPIQAEYEANGITNLTSTQIATCVGDYSDQGMWTDAADFFKLRSATLSYRLPEGWVPGTRSAQLQIQGRNLWTSTDYRGLDPEAQDNGFQDDTPNDYYTLGSPRVFIFGVTVSF